MKDGDDMNKMKKVNGIKTKFIFIPTMINIAILFALIIIATVFIEKTTYESTNEMKKTSEVSSLISDIQSNTSKLSETMTSFANTPLLPNNNLNSGPLDAYFDEYDLEDKKPDNILNKLNEYNLDDKAIQKVKTAVEAEKQMLKVQAHVLYLIDSVSYITVDQKYLSKVEKIELTTVEQNMPDDIKIALSHKYIQAYDDILEINYSDLKGVVSTSLRDAIIIVKENSDAKQNEITSQIILWRSILWTSISLILLANILFFILLLKNLILPIIKYTKKIDENDRLNEKGALYEANHLALAYNLLLDRHKELEKELRITAENDALTNMPNRYCYNNTIKSLELEEKSVCVFLFDINNLKYVNDTYGHSSGDELIVKSANCIKDCFSYDKYRNCYRIGGDEFVAIINNINEEEIKDYLENFKEKEKKYDVSIAIGYAYSPNIKEMGYEKLVIEADKNMYRNKNRIYKDNRQDFK